MQLSYKNYEMLIGRDMSKADLRDAAGVVPLLLQN